MLSSQYEIHFCNVYLPCTKFCRSRAIVGLMPSCHRAFVVPKFFLLGILCVQDFFSWEFRNWRNWEALNRTDNCWNRIHVLRWIYVFLFSVTLSHAANNWKSLNHEKNVCTHEIPTRKNFGTMKYLPRHDGTMALDPQDRRWHMTHEI